jgi:hypothetical protein
MKNVEIGDKKYIGDGAYAEWDGDCIILTTSNGISITNRIVLEFEVLQSLESFVADVKAAVTKSRMRVE